MKPWFPWRDVDGIERKWGTRIHAAADAATLGWPLPRILVLEDLDCQPETSHP